MSTRSSRRAGAGIWLLRALTVIVCAGLLAWMALALLYWPSGPRPLLAALVPVGALIALLAVRPLRRVPLVILAAFALVVGLWTTIPPSNDRDWQPDVAALARAEIDGDRLVVHNVRNVAYRSEQDYTVQLEQREYDLATLRSLDLFLIYWGSPHIAHTIMSFGFDDGRHLAFSIETRKEKGESYSAVRGFFRQYELVYIVADERDVIRVRTDFRGEDVYVYRLDAPPEGVRLLLMRYLEQVNALVEQPQWYNALTENCTTTIQHLAAPLERRNWWSWRLFANGHLDELAYEIGAIDSSLPFVELKARSYVNPRALAAGDAADFSQRIRAGSPRM